MKLSFDRFLGWLQVTGSIGPHGIWYEEYVALSSRKLLFYASSEVGILI